MEIDKVNFQTPENVCKYMVWLLGNIDSTKLILEPTPGAGNIVSALNKAGFTSETVDGDFFNFIPPRGLYDAVVMNPPFSPMTKGYKILDTCMELSNKVVALMPWLTLINSEKRTKKLVDYGMRSVTHLPRNTFKGSRVQTCVIDLERGWNGDTLFLDFNTVCNKID